MNTPGNNSSVARRHHHLSQRNGGAARYVPHKDADLRRLDKGHHLYYHHDHDSLHDRSLRHQLNSRTRHGHRTAPTLDGTKSSRGRLPITGTVSTLSSDYSSSSSSSSAHPKSFARRSAAAAATVTRGTLGRDDRASNPETAERHRRTRTATRKKPKIENPSNPLHPVQSAPMQGALDPQLKKAHNRLAKVLKQPGGTIAFLGIFQHLFRFIIRSNPNYAASMGQRRFDLGNIAMVIAEFRLFASLADMIGHFRAVKAQRASRKLLGTRLSKRKQVMQWAGIIGNAGYTICESGGWLLHRQTFRLSKNVAKHALWSTRIMQWTGYFWFLSIVVSYLAMASELLHERRALKKIRDPVQYKLKLDEFKLRRRQMLRKAITNAFWIPVTRLTAIPATETSLFGQHWLNFFSCIALTIKVQGLWKHAK